MGAFLEPIYIRKPSKRTRRHAQTGSQYFSMRGFQIFQTARYQGNVRTHFDDRSSKGEMKKTSDSLSIFSSFCYIVSSIINSVIPLQSDQFQEDLYPDTIGTTPSLSAKDWISGMNSPPNLISLKTGEMSKKSLLILLIILIISYHN